MDFIIGFPKVNGFTSIMAIMDRFSKYGTFVPMPKECAAEMTVKLFMKNIVKLYGIPTDIVSDHDTRFTERFWQTLFQQLGTKLKFSTTNYRQTDGQTERINTMLEYLRHFVLANQNN